jgi:hypothetical protein
VVDGLKLVDHVRAGAAPSYPFGLAPPPGPAPGSAEIDAVNSAVGDLLDAYDAVADLALAEGVHQAVLGNYDAVSATLEAYSKGNFPPEPDVVRTPAAGRTITHRVGLHVDAGASPPEPADAAIPVSPRASAQPAINAWLAGTLPEPAKIGCKVQWVDPATEDVLGDATVTQADLKLEPIDILYVATLDGAAAMSELDDRIVRHVMRTFTPRGDSQIKLLHTVRLPDPVVSFFELAPLVAHLRPLLLRSRPLTPSDIVPPGGDPADSTTAIDPARVQTVWDALKGLSDAVAAFAMPASIDASITEVVDLFERAARFGLTQAGWGFLYEWRRRTFGRVLHQLSDVVDRWTGRLKSFDQGWQAYTAQSGTMSDQVRIAALARLDLLVCASALSPRPTAPHDYEQALTGAGGRREAFEKKLTEFAGVPAAVTDGKLGSILAAVEAAAVEGTSPLATFQRRQDRLQGDDHSAGELDSLHSRSRGRQRSRHPPSACRDGALHRRQLRRWLRECSPAHHAVAARPRWRRRSLSGAAGGGFASGPARHPTLSPHALARRTSFRVARGEQADRARRGRERPRVRFIGPEAFMITRLRGGRNLGDGQEFAEAQCRCSIRTTARETISTPIV